MKIKEQSSSEMHLSDQAGCFWIFGLFFMLVGGIFIAGLLGMANNLDELSELEKFAGWIVSSGVFGAGVYFIYQNPGSKIIFNKNKGELRIVRKGLFRNEENSYSTGDIRGIILAEQKDSDGDPVFRIEAELKNLKRVPLSMLWLQNPDPMNEIIKKIQKFLE